eukprot:Nk52_evm3s2635 gene=Nk52_evmTU3s2635
MRGFVHRKCRRALEGALMEYPGTGGTVQRSVVPDGSVAWTAQLPGSCVYSPVRHTAPVVLRGPVWADLDLLTAERGGADALRFNEMDGQVDRTSFEGEYRRCSLVDVQGAGSDFSLELKDEAGWKHVRVPINPIGRTGVWGRGLLGRWGPNHAADPIVSRWKKDHRGEFVKRMVTGTGGGEEERRVLEFVAIKRKDSGEWAIPGGMVEPGDTVSATLKKEFAEEALNSLELGTPEQRASIKKDIAKVFQSGTEVYRGYVDDARNTDNAWMETVAVNFHANGGEFDMLKLHAGDDAGEVMWKTVDTDLKLYANHKDFLDRVVELRGAFKGE